MMRAATQLNNFVNTTKKKYQAQVREVGSVKRPIWPFLILLAILVAVLIIIGDQNAQYFRANAAEETKINQYDQQIKSLRDELQKDHNEFDQRFKQYQVHFEAVRLASIQPPRPKPVQLLGTGSHTDWMSAAGISPTDYGYVDYILSNESGWNPTIYNRSGSGAYGLGQALPASKMAPYGADYMTNPVTQLRWAQDYAIHRYGSWLNAYSYWVAHRVW